MPYAQVFLNGRIETHWIETETDRAMRADGWVPERDAEQRTGLSLGQLHAASGEQFGGFDAPLRSCAVNGGIYFEAADIAAIARHGVHALYEIRRQDLAERQADWDRGNNRPPPGGESSAGLAADFLAKFGRPEPRQQQCAEVYSILPDDNRSDLIAVNSRPRMTRHPAAIRATFRGRAIRIDPTSIGWTGSTIAAKCR
jgi:hypothetical protein